MPVPLQVLLPRTATFVAVAAFIIGGPIWTQVLHRPSKLFSEWTMFNGYGTDVYDVRFLEAGPDGTLSPLDRYALLGYGTKAQAPERVRKFTDMKEVRAVARRLCHVLPAGTDVRIEARKGTKKGWTPVAKAEENQCLTR